MTAARRLRDGREEFARCFVACGRFTFERARASQAARAPRRTAEPDPHTAALDPAFGPRNTREGLLPAATPWRSDPHRRAEGCA